MTQKVPAFPHRKALESSPQRSKAKGPGDWPFHWDLSSSVEMSQYWRWLTRRERAGQQDRAPETETPHEQCRVDLMSSVMSFRPALKLEWAPVSNANVYLHSGQNCYSLHILLRWKNRFRMWNWIQLIRTSEYYRVMGSNIKIVFFLFKF